MQVNRGKRRVQRDVVCAGLRTRDATQWWSVGGTWCGWRCWGWCWGRRAWEGNRGENWSRQLWGRCEGNRLRGRAWWCGEGPGRRRLRNRSRSNERVGRTRLRGQGRLRWWVLCGPIKRCRRREGGCRRYRGDVRLDAGNIDAELAVLNL